MATTYERHRESARARQAELARQGQELPEIPEPANPTRKDSCRGDFKAFCEAYFAEAFCLGWSKDHLRAISKIESAVKTGGLFALAMPRGSGKTTLCQTAVVWAALYGWTQFVVLVAASAERARTLLENIKVWLETNPVIHEDFPEVTVPVRALERIVHRQKGQKYKGTPTRIEWLSDRVVLPFIEGADSSGVVVACSGLKGSDLRGQNFSRPDGQVIRPSLVLIDDPQTSESAWSLSQSARREAILAGDVLGMAGPGKKIAGLMACTVIRNGDMADNILTREKHPEWHGERTKLIYKFPENGALWNKYAELRAESLLNDGEGEEATKFYSENREKMDAGAEVAWYDRYNQDELSAVQHAMNLRLRDETAFYAEYQNEPIQFGEETEGVDPEEVVGRLSHTPQGVVPNRSAFLTAFIDVHDKLLYWAVVAWETNYSGVVVDYGTFPDQPNNYFTLVSAKKTMMDLMPNAGQEAYIKNGVETLFERLMGGFWLTETGEKKEIDRLLIDANWGQTTDLIYQICRQSPYNGRVLPSHGKFVGASSKPLNEYKKSPGDRQGDHWRSPAPESRRGIRHILIDVNYWKSFLRARLSVPPGDRGSVVLYGDNPSRHRMISEHISAEAPVHVDNGSRRVDEWRPKPNRPDNHWLDCLVGNCVGACLMGATLDPAQKNNGFRPVERQRVSFSELYAKRNKTNG